jgi:hypothetical protein
MSGTGGQVAFTLHSFFPELPSHAFVRPTPKGVLHEGEGFPGKTEFEKQGFSLIKKVPEQYFYRNTGSHFYCGYGVPDRFQQLERWS